MPLILSKQIAGKMSQISIETVLAKLNDTVDVSSAELKVYGLRFITKEGEKREVRCRKYTKSPRQSIAATDPRGRAFYNLQANGVLLVLDLDTDSPKSIKAAMIYGFLDHQSEAWLNVFH